MRRLHTLLFFLLCTLATQAQNLAVQSFRMDQADLTANTAGTTVIDQNGNKCALIKVETTQTGFSFDVGTLGVTKTEQHVGEIWLYVPEGVKRITISHQQLGVLRDYDLGQMTKRAKTYILKLTTGEVQTIVKQARTSQYVVFQLQPKNAVVELDNQILPTADGMATKMMRFGTYDYRVQAPDYLPEVGKVTVNDPKNKHVVNVQLKPNFSQVTLTVDNNAEIWVNGQKKGNGSWTGNLGAGTYELETRLASHRSQSVTRDIAVTPQPQTIRLQAPIPIYGEADINSTPPMADIFIDGKKRGQTPQLIDQLLVGQHQVRLTRQGYNDYSGTITIKENESASLSASMTKIPEPKKPVATTKSESTAQKKNITFFSVDNSDLASKADNMETAPLNSRVYDVVEQMPSFPGGPAAMFEYLSKAIRYPVDAEKNGIQGRVICTIVVEKDGSISDVKVVKSVLPSLDKEAVRVVSSMPRWNPGKQSGSTVRVKYTIPLTFRLQ